MSHWGQCSLSELKLLHSIDASGSIGSALAIRSSRWRGRDIDIGISVISFKIQFQEALIVVGKS